MGNLVDFEEARFEQFADDTDIRVESAAAYCPGGWKTITFRSLDSDTNPVERANGEKYEADTFPGEPVIRGYGLIEGTDVRLNVKFSLHNHPGYKPYTIWCNVLKALGRSQPKDKYELQEILDWLEANGLRWKVGLMFKRGTEPFEFSRDDAKSLDLIKQGYTPINYLDRKSTSVSKIKD